MGFAVGRFEYPGNKFNERICPLCTLIIKDFCMPLIVRFFSKLELPFEMSTFLFLTADLLLFNHINIHRFYKLVYVLTSILFYTKYYYIFKIFIFI